MLMNDTASQAEMPRYVCHKQVWALKIAEVQPDYLMAKAEQRETDGSAMLVFEGGVFAPRKVSHDYVRKHAPAAGGYFVVYKDGYQSFSPADVFEEGYTRL